MYRRALKYYKTSKYGGDDAYSYAVFWHQDVKGLRSPISQLSNAKPIVTGCTRQEAWFHADKLEKEYLEKQKKELA